MVCTRKKGREKGSVKRRVTVTVAQLCSNNGKLGRRGCVGTRKCVECLSYCFPKSVSTGRGMPLLDELYNEVNGICGFMQLPVQSLKGCRRLAVFQPPTKSFNVSGSMLVQGSICDSKIRMERDSKIRCCVIEKRLGVDARVVMFLAQP